MPANTPYNPRLPDDLLQRYVEMAIMDVAHRLAGTDQPGAEARGFIADDVEDPTAKLARVAIVSGLEIAPEEADSRWRFAARALHTVIDRERRVSAAEPLSVELIGTEEREVKAEWARLPARDELESFGQLLAKPAGLPLDSRVKVALSMENLGRLADFFPSNRETRKLPPVLAQKLAGFIEASGLREQDEAAYYSFDAGHYWLNIWADTPTEPDAEPTAVATLLDRRRQTTDYLAVRGKSTEVAFQGFADDRYYRVLEAFLDEPVKTSISRSLWLNEVLDSELLD